MRWDALLMCVVLTLGSGACRQDSAPDATEIAYVSGASVEFRNELGPTSKVLGTFQSGERVQVLSTRPRWAEVRRSSGESGWVQQRSLVGQEIYDKFAAFSKASLGLPSQGRAVIRRSANLRLEPGRTTTAFYQLAEAEQVDVLGHRAVERQGSPAPKAGEASSFEDWLLVRADQERTGWMLESSAELNPPLEVAQYSEGLRIRAWFVIHREQAGGQEHSWYLWATTRKLAGLPYEFDEIRVFVWNPAASRYETSYRERNLTGFYPVEIGVKQTPDGETPTFRLHLQNKDGEKVERNYFMLGRQVRLEK